MAYRRCLSNRAKLLYQEQRFAPSISHINHHSDEEDRKRINPSSIAEASEVHNFFQTRCFKFGVNGYNGSICLNQGRRFSFASQPFINHVNYGSNFSRNMSTTAGEGAVGKIEYMTDVADVLADNTVEAVAAAAQAATVVNEVAVAAADSFLPVAALQHLIGYVHTFTGFDWWASIVLTTVLIRLVTVPLMINQLKATSKFTLLRPRLEEIKGEMQNRGMSPSAVAEGQARMQALFKEYGVTPFTPLRGLLIQGPIFISFFLAIKNMVEKVPSFKEGGAFWFMDLTTPDSFYILPILTAFTFWVTVESNMQEGMEGNPAAGTIKNVSRVFAALTIPLTASFEKGIFCYWITANLFSLMYGLVIKNRSVKNALGIPIIPVTPPPAGEQKPAFSFFEAVKKYGAAQAEAQKQQIVSSSGSQAEAQKKRILSSSGSQAEAPKQQALSSPTTNRSSSISQRISKLEREVKGRKKGRKK